MKHHIIHRTIPCPLTAQLTSKRLALSALAMVTICLALTTPLTPAMADPAAARPTIANHAISMHGAPKYAPTATHLDYANPNAPKGGTLTLSAAGTYDTLNPFSLKGRPAAGLDYVYDRLATRVWDEPFTLYGLIASDISTPPDRSSITFTINPAARFHDGAPITVDDVEFTFTTLRDHGRPNMQRVYKLVNKIDKKQNTITFHLSPGYDRETVMILALMPVLPKHVWQDKNFEETTLEIPIGSGPYRIASIDAGRKITYERVKDDWAKDHITRQGHYNFDTIIHDYYRDDGVALEAFKAGRTDLRREFDVAKWHTAYTDTNKDIVKQAIPHGRPEWVRGFIFNTRRAPFDSPAIRRALNLAFDSNYINNALYRGTAERITSIFPATDLAAPPLGQSLSRRESMRNASDLLTDAGWIVENGKRINAQTKAPLTFQIILSSAQDEKLALAYANSLRRLGIDASIRTLDAAQFAGALAAYDYDVVLHHWINSLSPGTEQLIYWGCDAANIQGSRNYSGVCTPEIDAAAQNLASAQTRDELITAARNLDTLIMSQDLFVPLFTLGVDYWAYWNKIKRPNQTPLYGASLETWWHE